jgi:hypothetical protein
MAILISLVFGCSPGTDEQTPTVPPPSTPAPQPTLAPGQRTVGDLLMGIDAAWPSVTSMRATLSSGPAEPGSEESVEPWQSIEEVILPSSRRVLTITGDVVSDEHVFVDGRVFMRGALVTTAVAPNIGPSTWIAVDPSLVPDTSPVGQQLAYLTSPIQRPFTGVSTQMQTRGTTSLGAITVGNRSCTAYAFVDTTAIGEQIDYELAIDSAGLPCQLVQRAGGFANTTVYEFNDPGITIVAPDAATPVSGTPAG